MRLKSSSIEIALLLLVYLSTLYVWTLPLQGNTLPFGDVDASSHFTIGDYMLSTDASVLRTPYHITFRYGGQNNAFPDYLWYPPQYWTNAAIAQSLGGDRLLPFFLIVALFCSIIVLTSYFLIRALFGMWPALLSSLLLGFSTRDYMIYLWGQWPQSLSFALTPVALYCLYRYVGSYAASREGTPGEKEEKKKERLQRIIYASLYGLVLAGQFFFHPQGMIAAIGASLFFVLFLIIRDRKIPFSFRDMAIGIGMLIAVAVAFAPFNVGEFVMELLPQGGSGGQTQPPQYAKLFQWYQGISNDPGLPDFYFTYNKTHGSLDGGLLSWWTLPLLAMGIAALLMRRRSQELLMLAWLTSFYILTRLVIFGIGSRDIRMFAYEAHVFYPLIALGLLAIPSFFQVKYHSRLRAGLIAIFIILAIVVNGASAYKTLAGMQHSISRISPYQYGAAAWLRDNTPPEADIYDFGTLGFQNYAAKVKWMGVLAQRHFIVNDGKEQEGTDYILIDYTDALALHNEEYINAIRQFEQQFANATALYNQNNIRVYKANGLFPANA